MKKEPTMTLGERQAERQRRTVDIETDRGTVSAYVEDAESIWVRVTSAYRAPWESRYGWEDGELIGAGGELSEDDQRQLAAAIVDAGLRS